MRDFQCKSAADIQNEELAKGVRYFKENEGGRKVMCEAVERYADQRAIEAIIETAIKYGASRAQIVNDICEKFFIEKEVAEQIYERFAPATV